MDDGGDDDADNKHGVLVEDIPRDGSLCPLKKAVNKHRQTLL